MILISVLTVVEILCIALFYHEIKAVEKDGYCEFCPADDGFCCVCDSQ